MWERYNEVHHLNAQIESSGILSGDEENARNLLFEHYENRDFILVDESHNFRNPGTQRYRVLQEFLTTGTKRVASSRQHLATKVLGISIINSNYFIQMMIQHYQSSRQICGSISVTSKMACETFVLSYSTFLSAVLGIIFYDGTDTTQRRMNPLILPNLMII